MSVALMLTIPNCFQPVYWFKFFLLSYWDPSPKAETPNGYFYHLKLYLEVLSQNMAIFIATAVRTSNIFLYLSLAPASHQFLILKLLHDKIYLKLPAKFSDYIGRP
jgi:hypothetical protein